MQCHAVTWRSANLIRLESWQPGRCYARQENTGGTAEAAQPVFCCPCALVHNTLPQALLGASLGVSLSQIASKSFSGVDGRTVYLLLPGQFLCLHTIKAPTCQKSLPRQLQHLFLSHNNSIFSFTTLPLLARSSHEQNQPGRQTRERESGHRETKVCAQPANALP